LAHIHEHAVLEIDLILLGVFNKDTAGEDQEKAESEEEAGTHAARIMAIEIPSYEKEAGIAKGLVELAGMARKLIYSLEDEGPGHIGGAPDNLAVHEVAQPDSASADRRNDAHIIQNVQERQLHLSSIEHQSDHKAQRAAVTGKSFVAGHHPVSPVVARRKPLEPGCPQLGP